MTAVLTRPGSFAVPFDVELGAADTIRPTAIFAHFNGAGAAGSFLPCVTYYTQDGLVFARAFPADAVAAGASADVSWFPGLAQAPSSTTPAGSGDYTFIAEQVVAASGVTNTITFLAIPQTYRHLVMQVSVGHVAGPAGTPDNLDLTWNTGITTYDYSTFSNYTRTSFNNTQSAPAVTIGLCVPRVFAAGADMFGQLTFVFPYYSQTDRIATVTWEGVSGAAGICTGMGNAGFGGVGANGAISRIDLVTSPRTFAQDSKASLYGIT